MEFLYRTFRINNDDNQNEILNLNKKKRTDDREKCSLLYI